MQTDACALGVVVALVSPVTVTPRPLPTGSLPGVNSGAAVCVHAPACPEPPARPPRGTSGSSGGAGAEVVSWVSSKAGAPASLPRLSARVCVWAWALCSLFWSIRSATDPSIASGPFCP